MHSSTSTSNLMAGWIQVTWREAFQWRPKFHQDSNSRYTLRVSSHPNALDVATRSATNARVTTSELALASAWSDPLGVLARSAEKLGDPMLAEGHPDSTSSRRWLRRFANGTWESSDSGQHFETHHSYSCTFDDSRIFCPIEHRMAVVEMMERHFCAHPLIPGYSAPTPEGIKSWAMGELVSAWKVGAVGTKW